MKRALAIISVSVAAAAAVVLLELFRPFAYQQLRNGELDRLTRAARTTPANPNLVFLAIDSASATLDETDITELYGLTDDDSVEARTLRLMSHDFPWSREVYAMIIERLVNAGAKVVLFDLLFPASSANDEPFRLALERYGARVVIGSNFVDGTSNGFSETGASHTPPVDTLIPQTRSLDERLGYVNMWPDQTGVVRRAQYRVTFEQVDRRYSPPDAEQFLSLVARGLTKAGHADAVPAGVEPRLFRFTGGPRVGFPPRSVFEIFVPEYWRQNYGNGEFFRGKIVLIGAEGNWHQDEHLTPFGTMPGPEIHLNAMNAALHNEFIDEVPFSGVALAVLFAAGIAVALSLTVQSPWLRLLVLLLIDVSVAAVALLLFNRGTYLPVIAPLAQLNVAVLLALIADVAWERVERNRVRRTLERYVSSNVVQQLLGNSKQFEQSLGGVIKPVAILFSDIRGYSTVTARTDPHALVSQLNEYLSAMVECVFRHGGTLDKFIGDAVMAVWGNVRSDGIRTDAANAVRAALAMRDELARLNQDWRARGLPELRVGIAVNHGDVVVGNVGSAQRMEFTVIGDAVNISWKLQELTKQLGTALVVSGSVAPMVVEEFELQPLGQRVLPGRDGTIEVFSVEGPLKLPSEAPVPDQQLAVSHAG